MSLAAGDLSHRLMIQREVVTQDEEGSAISTGWVDVAQVWAKRTNTLRATAEALAAGQEVAPVQVRFDMRPRALDASMRLVGVGGDHDGVVYDIVNIGISNDRSEMAVMAISGKIHG